MAPIKVGLNGFGRIGRLAFRLMFEHPDVFEVVHVNEFPGVGESCAYLAQFDSVHGTWADVNVEFDAGSSNLVVSMKDGRVCHVKCSCHEKPADVPWAESGVAMIMECTGVHLTRASLAPYFACGVKKVVVSAPVKDAESPVLNIVYGVNHGLYDASKDHIVTAARCTTNCLAPVVKVIHEKLGIVRGSITTIHDVTNTQMMLDATNAKKSDLRRARSGMVNLAPTSTGSATAIALIFPELKGKLNGVAVRVPLTNASLTDSVFEVSRGTTIEEVNGFLKEAATSPDHALHGILGYETRPLVSTDYINDRRSGIVDAPSTMVVDGSHVKILTWYDNEMGYSARMVDVARMVAASL